MSFIFQECIQIYSKNENKLLCLKSGKAIVFHLIISETKLLQKIKIFLQSELD